MVDDKCANIFSNLKVDLNSKYLDTKKKKKTLHANFLISLRSILYNLN